MEIQAGGQLNIMRNIFIINGILIMWYLFIYICICIYLFLSVYIIITISVALIIVIDTCSYVNIFARVKIPLVINEHPVITASEQMG